MTVKISKPAVNLREELASLRNQGDYSEQKFYFDGLVTNGTFDTDTSNWTLKSGGVASVSSGILTLSNNTSGARLHQYITTEVGKAYILSVTNVDLGTSSSAKTQWGTTQYSLTSGENTIAFVATSTSTEIVVFNGSGANVQNFSLDNITVYETDGTDVIHTMPKGWKPKDVYENGLLQREGSAHDYEVIYDGFDYVVKPTVAPSADTQTCVIGVKA